MLLAELTRLSWGLQNVHLCRRHPSPSPGSPPDLISRASSATCVLRSSLWWIVSVMDLVSVHTNNVLRLLSVLHLYTRRHPAEHHEYCLPISVGQSPCSSLVPV